MHAPKPALAVEPGLDVVTIAKAIADLECLIQSLLTMLPNKQIWQRQLRTYMVDADRQMEILRLSIAMERDISEILATANGIVTSLKAARAYLQSGRADAATKGGIQLALGLSKNVEALLAGWRVDSYCWFASIFAIAI